MLLAARPNLLTRWSLVLFLGLTAVVAVMLNLSTLQELQTSDSLIFSLTSLYVWTPFFWEQDRVGMVVPLLMQGIRHPLANLLAITGTMIFVGLGLPLMLARLFNRGQAGLIAATLANAVLVATGPAILMENQFIVCCYPLGMFLGCCGLGVLEPATDGRIRWWRIGLSLGFMILAFWAYVAVIVVLLPLAVLRVFVMLPDRSLRRRLGAMIRSRLFHWGLACTFLGFTVGYAGMTWSRQHYPVAEATSASMLPVAEWPMTVVRFLNRFLALPGSPIWLGTWGIVALVGLAGRWRFGAGVHSVWPVVGSLLLIGLVELAFVSTREWTAINEHHPRYLLGLLTCWQLALALAVVAGVRWPDRVQSLGTVAVIGLFLCVPIVRYGVPSISGTRALLNHNFGSQTAALFDRRCQGYHDEYWTLWPTVFHANWMRYEQGQQELFLPFGFRTANWWEHWAAELDHSPVRIGTTLSDVQTLELYARYWELNVQKAATQADGLVIYTLTPKTHPDR